ncbi:MAG: ATP-binding cassette domain-containing protein [Euryarchaeota archaeon]|nr:ATP-binding cassette domain-containing protein [Euryarchaeota archaeon]
MRACVAGGDLRGKIRIGGIEKLRKKFTFTLSGGEKQRTAIAGVLSMEPKILILDEPTSDLDPAGTKQVLETVKRLNKDRAITIILIEHKIDEVVGLADRTIVMDRGKIVLDGKTCDVFNRNLDILERIGIYPPHLIRLSRKLGVKPSTKIIFEDVQFNYLNGTPVLRGINLEIKNLNVAELAVKVGYLFQNPDLQLFTDTVAEEIGFGLKNRSLATVEINKNVAQALEIMELSKYRDRHPHSLSRGQRQRLAVASILSMEQDILVLDEPTTGQDRGHLSKFLGQMKKLNDAGKILMDGSTREVFSRPDILNRASIELPLLARISNDLNKAGRKVPVILTFEELQYSLKIKDNPAGFW